VAVIRFCKDLKRVTKSCFFSQAIDLKRLIIQKKESAFLDIATKLCYTFINFIQYNGEKI